MKLTEILKRKTIDNPGTRTPIIAFLGDSVTQGCFECYMQGDVLDTVFDSEKAYPERVKHILGMLYPKAPVSVMNFGVSGSCAPEAVKRLEQDVLPCKPDLLIVCFGLNDSNGELEGVEKYKSALKEIFRKAKNAEVETIFMTPNMFNTYTSHILKEDLLLNLADIFEKRQRNGVFDAYIEAAKEACKEENIRLCDCYDFWKKMDEKGADITALLANGLNHPTRDMHELFAWQLIHTILND